MKKLILLFGFFTLPFFAFSNVDSIQLPIVLGDVHFLSVYDADFEFIPSADSNEDAAFLNLKK